MATWDDELAALTAQRGQALTGYAYLLCGNRRDAEDVVQDALVKVFSRLRGRGPTAPRQTAATSPAGETRLFTLDDASGSEGDRPVAHLEGYVRRAILTLYLDGYRRRRSWLGLRHLVGQRESVPGPEAPASARADTAKALAGLTPRQRACVVLRYYEDLTVPRIAEELGCAEGTVKRHLSDAMAVMQQTLGATPAVVTTTQGDRTATTTATPARPTGKAEPQTEPAPQTGGASSTTPVQALPTPAATNGRNTQ
ncbi:RNA polymerase sigma factor [Oerskovia enterophila]|uniref:RNA polymerase sigma factor n=1 Tax=Oerskovia enterophila TaxID=43678 RepID=A0ABX2XZ26_9CELL|nr:sigma-70 family RNA polymerase sigma factor [Oerskovia enterophila]OCI29563.1 RNA polymerase sigma factor [Oerskovia enterophila]